MDENNNADVKVKSLSRSSAGEGVDDLERGDAPLNRPDLTMSAARR
jgi:hypothetical protein